MPNQAGIDDHNGPNAELLAQRYASIDKRKIYPEIYQYIDKAAAEGRSFSVLDIGSGSGDDAIEIANAGHHVVGVEPSDLRHIAVRDHSHPNVEYRNGMLPKLETIHADEKFDLVILSAVWQYIAPEDRLSSLKRIAETIKPNGKLILVYPSPPSREHQYEASPEMLRADIEAANAQLPKSKKLSINGEPLVMPDVSGRKSLDGRDLNYYTFTIETGHAQSLGTREGFSKKTLVLCTS